MTTKLEAQLARNGLAPDHVAPYGLQDYLRERAICDKAQAYWQAHASHSKSGSSMSQELCRHPDYAACSNEMRGRVERFEIFRDKPDRLTVYVSTDQKRATTWTGLDLGSLRVTSSWRVNSYVGSRMFQFRATIAGREYSGRGFGAGMCLNLRAVKG